MRDHAEIWKQAARLGLLLAIAATMGACAGFLGGTSWKEEVLLHDGRSLVVSREVVLQGRHEIGQEPPIGDQRLSFTHPGTSEEIHWDDKFSDDIRSANFLPMLLDVHRDAVYLVAQPMGCLSYNKWGRPNPPYVVFRYEKTSWKRIELRELPAEIKTPNLIFSSPDTEARSRGTGRTISASAIRALYDNYKQPQNKTILREALSQERINQMCEERILYKGSWILPNDPVARKFIDQQKR